MDNTLGEMILQKRKEKNLTQAQLAQRFGISDKAVSKWERNISKPDKKFMPELVDILGLPKELLPAKTKAGGDSHMLRVIIVKEIFRILCIGNALAAVICLSFGLLAVESAITLTGASLSVFALITLIKNINSRTYAKSDN